MTVREKAIQEIIKENERRNAEIYAKFDPVTGYGSVGERKKIVIDDFPIHTQWVPVEMMKVPLVAQLVECGSIRAFLTDCMEVEYNEADRLKVIEQFVRLRFRYDFPFWAATQVYIKNKDGGEDVLFRLTRPQRRFVARLERLRKAEKAVGESEAKIGRMESRLKELDTLLCKPENASDMKLINEYTAVKRDLDAEVERWEQLSEDVEKMKNEE